MSPDTTADADSSAAGRSLPFSSAAISRQRRTYSPPRLIALGDVRSFVLGGSPGIGDSGAEGAQKIPGT